MGLPISPGIDGLPTNTIPDDPAQFVAWFKAVGIKRWLANADVRNASPTYPVTITGTNATNATVGVSAEAAALIEAIELIPNDTVVGNISGSTACPSALTQTQLTALVNEFTSSLAGDVPASGGGTTNFLRADGTWASVTATVTAADSITGNGSSGTPLELVNDSASPGNSMLYGTNGSGTKGWFSQPTGGSGTVTSITAGTGLTGGTITTSGTIAQSLTWSPTQNGNWIYTPTSGIGITANGFANSDAISIKGSSTAGQSYGLGIQAGTNSSDGPLYIESYGGTQILDITGDGGIQVGSPTGTDKGAGTINVSGGYYVNGVLVTSFPGSPVQGDIVYYNGSNWANLAPGTAGQILQTGGSSANPSWITNTGASVATPGTIPDLCLWWESDDINQASGTVVGRLRERTPWILGLAAQSGAATSTTGNTVSASTLNSLPTITWNASGGAATVYTISGGGFPTGSSGGNAGVTIFAVFNSGATVGAGSKAIIGGTAGSCALYLGSASNALALVKSGSSVIGTSTTTWSTGTWYQANATYNSTTGAYAFRQARTAAGSGTGATAAGTATTVIGQDDGANDLSSCSLAALIVYNRVLTNTQITSIETYLNTKWGV